MADNHFTNPRLQPCYLLHESKIPCVVWFEDAIGHYGVPTVVFKLHILVPNIDEATEVLVQRGWTLAAQDPSEIQNAMANRTLRYLMPPKDDSAKTSPNDPQGTEKQLIPQPSKDLPGQTTTLLLPAADWNFTLLEYCANASIDTFYPPLPALLDALIDSLLDTPSNDTTLQRHLACQVSYLYLYVPVLREKSFAEHLKYEHRQFHFDWLSGMSVGTLPFIAHEHTIRDALRQGKYQLQECSASRDNKALFNQEEQARLLATLPPVSFDDYGVLEEEELFEE